MGVSVKLQIWPSAEKGRMVGAVPWKMARVMPVVWLFPVDLVCCLIWLCFVLLLLEVTTNCCNIIVRWCSYVRGVALSILHHSPPVYHMMDWADSQTSNNQYYKWWQEKNWSTWDCRRFRVTLGKEIVWKKDQFVLLQATWAWLTV